jgi:hypothetical protein
MIVTRRWWNALDSAIAHCRALCHSPSVQINWKRVRILVARETIWLEYIVPFRTRASRKRCARQHNRCRPRDDARPLGYPKTPDFKLELPIIVDGTFVVNWIESKATFGDAAMHANALREQYTAYVNRYGPGLVIYWFGYVKPESEQLNGVIVRDRLPRRHELTTLS